MEERGTVVMSSFIVKVGGPLVKAPGAVVMVAGVLLEVGWSVASVEVMDLVRLELLAVVIVLVGGALVEVVKVVVGVTVEICKPLVGLVVVDSVVGLPAERI